MGQETGQPDGGQHTGGGAQGERIEGTLTNGGSQAGERSFAPRTPGHTAPEGEGGGTMSGRGQEEGEGYKAQFQDAEERQAREEPGENPGQVGMGGAGGAGTGGGDQGGDQGGGQGPAARRPPDGGG
jgi:hypothetical protein